MKNQIDNGQRRMNLRLEESKIAKSLEFFPFLDIKDRIFLVLIWRKLKFASAMSLEAGAPERIMRDLQERVEKAGLLFKRTGHIITAETKDKHGLSDGEVCFVANNPENMKLISELWFENHNKPEVSRKLGELSGYPETSLALYEATHDPKIPLEQRKKAKEDLILTKEEKQAFFIQKPELYPFSTLFYMSKAHKENESETVRKWAEAIESTTFALYNAFIEASKKSQNSGEN